MLRRRPAVLTGGRPGPGLGDVARRNGLRLVRLVPPGGSRGAASDGRIQIDVPDGEASGLNALLDDPALAVVVRPDRVVASLARLVDDAQLPPLPWSARGLAATTPTTTTVQPHH